MRVNVVSPHPVEKVVGRVGIDGSVAVDTAGQSVDERSKQPKDPGVTCSYKQPGCGREENC